MEALENHVDRYRPKFEILFVYKLFYRKMSAIAEYDFWMKINVSCP